MDGEINEDGGAVTVERGTAHYSLSKTARFVLNAADAMLMKERYLRERKYAGGESLAPSRLQWY